jgi:hypothetical protein
VLADFGARVSGTRITSVADGSSAATFSFQPGDMVVSINGRTVPPGSNFLDLLSTYPPQQMMKFVVERDGKPVELAGFFTADPKPRAVRLFAHASPSGRVDLVKAGNTVRATTRGVEGFTLLLSPDAFDFATPVTVIADGKTVFEGRVTRSVSTLMKWAARDNDRTMLFGAELQVKLTK